MDIYVVSKPHGKSESSFNDLTRYPDIRISQKMKMLPVAILKRVRKAIPKLLY